MKYQITIIIGIFICLIGCKTTESINTQKPEDNFSIEYPEVYELANIALALTEYGKTDKWQVRKDIEYYDKTIEYFSHFERHPLIDSINFSRERWEEYLSYRTDAYAFAFDDDNSLKRINEFKSFEIETFDKYKELTEDFAEQSNFRKFYVENKSFYDSIVENYRNEYMLKEMRDFLNYHFGNYFENKKYSIVISPFVYAQNLHRDIDSTWTADFPAVAKEIIEGRGFGNPEDKSSEVHTLFTEMDHGYVNPTTNRFLITDKFDELKWDDESGYAGNGKDVFNEYMTWAVFDIFNRIEYPTKAEKINLNWHFQNDSRGFQYSNLFASKLIELSEKEPNSKISDIYPKILEWTRNVQEHLTKPVIINKTDTLIVNSETNKITVNFSETMKKSIEFDVILYFDQWNSETKRINETNNLIWKDDGKSLSFNLSLPNKNEYYLLFNWWGVSEPIMSEKNTLLKAGNGFVVKGNSADNNK